MTQQEIQAYNQKLVNENEVITIIEYVKKLNDKFYHIDIPFIDDFIDLVNKEDCCINHEILAKYEITSLTSGSNDAKKIIERNDGVEGVDFEVRPEAERIIYLLHPSFFKKLLIRSKNTDKYADYYLLLEKCVKYYNDYQILKLQNKIDKLENTLENRVIPPSCKSKIENLVIVYLEEELEFQYFQ